MRDLLRKQLIVEEGVRLHPYTDTVGKLTIGIGRNLTDSGISEPEAQLLLDNDILRTEAELSTYLDWFHDLDPVRQDVLIDMAFNMGTVGLFQFKLMLAAVELGNYEAASAEMLKSRWAEQVGKRATRLAEQMRTGNR